VANTPRRMHLATAFAIPGCGLIIAASIVQSPPIISVSHVVVTLFLIYASAAILEFVFRARRVDASVILGSLCVYILIAVIWGEFYGLILLNRPGSLMLPATDSAGGIRGLLEYFSFVTITTVGYGDIYPISPLARATAATEALIGQLYLVVLVARLVGLHTAQEARERN
jgi:voltage-gated potassium channel Kch